MNSALYAASEHGNAEKVSILIEKGAEVNSKDEDGNTALMKAISKGLKHIDSVLVESGAEVNVTCEVASNVKF